MNETEEGEMQPFKVVKKKIDKKKAFSVFLFYTEIQSQLASSSAASKLFRCPWFW